MKHGRKKISLVHYTVSSSGWVEGANFLQENYKVLLPPNLSYLMHILQPIDVGIFVGELLQYSEKCKNLIIAEYVTK